MSTTERTTFAEQLAERGVLIADGATGTNYQTMGMEPGLAPEEWLFQAPETRGRAASRLRRRRRRHRPDLHLRGDAAAAHRGAAGRAGPRGESSRRRARAGGGRAAIVSWQDRSGRPGQLIEPYGLLNREDAVAAYAEQAQALADGGVDLLVLETIFAVEEAVWAVEGIQSVTDLPLVVSFSFDMGTRTMMGLSPTDAVAAVIPLGIAAVGTNCGRSLKDADLVVTEILAAAGDVPVWVKPNAGVPKIVGAEVVYEAGPEMLAEHVARYVEQGVQDRRRVLRLDARARRGDRQGARALDDRPTAVR